MIDIIEALRAHIVERHRNQSNAARAWGVSPTFVHLVLKGVKRPNDTMLAEMGLERVVIYRKREAA